MDSILIILNKKKNGPRASSAPIYTGTIFYNIRIYSRSQVSVYRTIGPLVLKLNNPTVVYLHLHFWVSSVRQCQHKNIKFFNLVKI